MTNIISGIIFVLFLIGWFFGLYRLITDESEYKCPYDDPDKRDNLPMKDDK